MPNTYNSIHTGTTIDNTINYLKTPSTSITLGTTWTGSDAPYTQVVNCSGVSASYGVVVGLDLSSVAYDDIADVQMEYSKIYRVETLNNQLKFYADEPTEQSLQLIIVK